MVIIAAYLMGVCVWCFGPVQVLAGVVVLTGCTFTNTQFFLNVGGVGAFVAQLGGESGV
jgi:hypothetical protein